jgi:hypothetical protein
METFDCNKGAAHIPACDRPGWNEPPETARPFWHYLEDLTKIPHLPGESCDTIAAK